MRMLRIALGGVLVVLGWAASAAANPIAPGTAAAVQVPETFHVQVSYGCLDDLGEPLDPADGYVIARDGVPFTAVWLGPTSVRLNAGSGLGSASVLQVCDCGVAPGPHTYAITMPDGASACAATTLAVTVTDPPPAPPAPWVEPNPDDYEYPWDIPEPPWPKGVDCAAVCAEPPPVEPTDVARPPTDVATPADVPPPTDVASATDGPGPPRPDTAGPSLDTALSAPDAADRETAPGSDPPVTIPGDDEEAADCAAGGRAPLVPLALLALGLLAMGALARRRRRG